MAKYNTFLILTTKGKPLLVTSSARKAGRLLQAGVRVEVWSANEKAATIYQRTREKLGEYIAAERDHIRAKQEAAERRNKKRRKNHDTDQNHPQG